MQHKINPICSPVSILATIRDSGSKKCRSNFLENVVGIFSRLHKFFGHDDTLKYQSYVISCARCTEETKSGAWKKVDIEFSFLWEAEACTMFLQCIGAMTYLSRDRVDHIDTENYRTMNCRFCLLHAAIWIMYYFVSLRIIANEQM